MEAASRNVYLSATKEGPPRTNIARDLMNAVCRTLKFNHNIEILPKSLQSLTAINYYLFGVDGKGVKREMRTARIHLTEKLKKKSEIFNLLLEEGLKSKDLQKLFTGLKSQWNAVNEVINENSIIVLKKLNGNEVTIEVVLKKLNIEVDALEKNDIRSLKEKLQTPKTFTSKIPYQKGDGAGMYILREFMEKFINTLKNDHHIRVPKKRFENINVINYYLFGVGIDKEMEEFRLCLAEKLDKSTIFSIFLEEGLKNQILQANFKMIKNKWDNKGGVLNENSVIVIKKLNKNQVTVSIDLEE